MRIRDFQFNMFGVNTYIVWDPESRDAAIIDPGMITAGDQSLVTEFLSSNNLNLTHLINTHLHIDHTFGNDYIKSAYGLATEANADDEFLGERRDNQAKMFGLQEHVSPLYVDRQLNDGEQIMIGNDSLWVLAVPGHSPGSIALYSPSGKFVITGDALFQNSIGRTDLPGGNHALLLNSIRGKLFALPDDIVVYPGHGPKTTVGQEKMLNPYV